MRFSKKFLLVLLTVVLLVTLNSCIVIPLFKNYSFSSDEISSVQIYDLRDQNRESYPYIFTTYEPVYTIPEEDLETFISDFANIEFTDAIVIVLAAIDPSFSYGEWVIRINFSNGDFSFYSSAGYGETFDSEGNLLSNTHFSCDHNDLENLISKYYSIESSTT